MPINIDFFDQLYRESYSRLFYYSYGFLDDREACRDVLADVYERLWNTKDTISPDTAVSYLYQSVRNRCIDYIRHQNITRQYADYVNASAEADTQLQPDEIDQRIAKMRSAMDLMSPKTRSVLEECYFNNKKYSEVAAQMDISVNTVKKHIMKALALLREQFHVNK